MFHPKVKERLNAYIDNWHCYSDDKLASFNKFLKKLNDEE
jgi:hypothetical protein